MSGEEELKDLDLPHGINWFLIQGKEFPLKVLYHAVPAPTWLFAHIKSEAELDAALAEFKRFVLDPVPNLEEITKIDPSQSEQAEKDKDAT